MPSYTSSACMMDSSLYIILLVKSSKRIHHGKASEQVQIFEKNLKLVFHFLNTRKIEGLNNSAWVAFFGFFSDENDYKFAFASILWLQNVIAIAIKLIKLLHKSRRLVKPTSPPRVLELVQNFRFLDPSFYFRFRKKRLTYVIFETGKRKI